jgi:hypothetical protein
LIGVLHLGQNEKGFTIDKSLGRRQMQTLRKLPMTAPKIKENIFSIIIV